MITNLLDRLWGPQETRRELVDGPVYGWVHLDNGVCQLELSLIRITTSRPGRLRPPVESWEVEWRTDLANETFAPLSGDPVPVPADAVTNASWDVLACVLLRNEITMNPARYGMEAA